MGSICAKIFDEDDTPACDRELQEIKRCLGHLLKQLSPDELLTLVVEDKEIYEICRDDHHLRANCILAAIRRYHCEKFFHENVHNRTADYVIIMDTFLDIQEKYERQQDRAMAELQRPNILIRCFCRDRYLIANEN